MIKEVENTNQTGVVYLREDSQRSTGMIPGGRVNLLNPTFSVMGTGEDTRLKPHGEYKFHYDLLPYQLLARTTGSELHDFLALLAYLGCTVVSDSILTHHQVTFEIADLGLMKLPILHESTIEQSASSGTSTASPQAERLREISGLKIERLGEILGVSRTTYSKWLSGSPLHSTHRERLLEVLSLVEEAVQHLGSSSATNTWLLTPVSPGGKKPIEYLAEREYATFRGFLLRANTSRGTMFHPLISSSSRVRHERSHEEREARREQLRPRVWREEDNDNNTSAEND